MCSTGISRQLGREPKEGRKWHRLARAHPATVTACGKTLIEVDLYNMQDAIDYPSSAMGLCTRQECFGLPLTKPSQTNNILFGKAIRG